MAGSYFDLALVETGSGGDLQLSGNDLAIVYSVENMPYLGIVGGNLEQSTIDGQVTQDSLDWWGNSVNAVGNASIQFNSTVERILNSTELTSAGRSKIENAFVDDLKFLTPILGAAVKVNVTIVSTDRIDVTLTIPLDGKTKVTVIKFKKQSDGDFSIFDFNDDFY